MTQIEVSTVTLTVNTFLAFLQKFAQGIIQFDINIESMFTKIFMWLDFA